MRHVIGFLIASSGTLLAPPVLAQTAAQDQQITRGPAPTWALPSEPMALPERPSGLAFVRNQDTVVHFDAHGKSTFVAQRVALLQPQALQFGNIAIAWNPASGKPTIHAVRIHRGAETIEVLDKAEFEVLRREDQLEQAKLSGTLTAVLKVPDLRVGDELEMAYTLPTGDPTLQDKSADMLQLAGSALPGRYRLGVSWEPGAKPQIRTTDDFSAPLIQSANALDVRVDNPAPLNPPKDAPPRYSWQRLIEVSDFASWGSLSQKFAGLFETAGKLRPGSPLRQEATRIAAATPNPLGRAQAALGLVQQQVRYIYVGLNGGNYSPAQADDTWQRRYGDCKAKTALLLALLGELGIPAQPVLVRNGGPDDGFDARLPNPALFDHVLLRATIAGKQYWLDGTLPVVATASEQPDFPYHWVLPVGTDGKQALEHLAWKRATVPDTIGLYEIDARAGFNAPARIVSTTIKRGPAALLEFFQMSAIGDEQRLQALRSELAGAGSWDTIESVNYRFDAAARASILEITATGSTEWEDDGDGERSLSLPGGGFSPPSKRQRAAGPSFDAPFYDEPNFSCYATTVRLPSTTNPENWSFNTDFDTILFGHLYYRAFERRDATIRMIRGSRTEQPEIDSMQVLRDNGRLAHFDNSKGSIAYSPKQKTSLPPSKSPVPATYEGDWVNAASACLPSDMKR